MHSWFWPCHGTRSFGLQDLLYGRPVAGPPPPGPPPTGASPFEPMRQGSAPRRGWRWVNGWFNDEHQMHLRYCYIYIVYSYLYNWRWIHDDRPSNERFKVNYIEFAHANYIYCRYAYVVTPKCQVERGDSISCLSWKDYAFSLARKYAADRPLWLAFCAGAPLPFAQTWLKTVS
jgi:hypothetical protein